MKRFGYHARTCHHDKINDVLNALGEQGWELVSVNEPDEMPPGMLLLVLKREIPA